MANEGVEESISQKRLELASLLSGDDSSFLRYTVAGGDIDTLTESLPTVEAETGHSQLHELFVTSGRIPAPSSAPQNLLLSGEEGASGTEGGMEVDGVGEKAFTYPWSSATTASVVDCMTGTTAGLLAPGWRAEI
ncbi:hypothetical protein KIPB_011428, partial [Kipferlia bialata]|eukprot:g11428.t1